jgi:hypothetical protein
MELMDGLLEDFNLEAQDGSANQVGVRACQRASAATCACRPGSGAAPVTAIALLLTSHQVARSLVELYQACCRGDAGPLQALRQRQAAGGASGAAASKRVTVRRARAQTATDFWCCWCCWCRWWRNAAASLSGDLTHDASVVDACTRAVSSPPPPTHTQVDLDGTEVGSSSSSSGSDDGSDDDDMMDADAPDTPAPAAAAAAAAQQPAAPVVDADGFEMVQTRRSRRQGARPGA